MRASINKRNFILEFDEVPGNVLDGYGVDSFLQVDHFSLEGANNTNEI